MARQHNATVEGRRQARRMTADLGEEIRIARASAGLGQRAAATAAGMSHHQFGRIERGEVSTLSFDQLCRASIAVGLQFSGRLYPGSDPTRDTPSLRLIERFVALLPALARVDREAPLPLAGDLRAWDALVQLGGRRAGTEAETRIADVQALERKLALKARDGGVDLVILVVADTRHNREVLALHREALRALLPLDGPAIRAALRQGRLPRAGGVILV